ncbi:MAG: hypothetical protein M1480_11970 [Bacteroidetes bacterium]|nr:hypothetical protein [Bacteroidota bacterium]
MKTLNLDSFISKETDIEKNQYKILSGLKEYRLEFNLNKLYPSLSELVYLSSQLEEIFDRKGNISIPLPKGIKGKTKDKNIFIEIVEQQKDQKDYLYDLINWAIPLIKNLIDEAYILYNFVEDNMEIIEVGVKPVFKNEGYLLVPDNIQNVLKIYRYESSIYSSEVRPFHSLKTSFIQNSKQLNFSGAEEFVKLELIKKYKDKPNIATYLCNTELDFPFDETVFPIAKRKLLDHLSL